MRFLRVQVNRAFCGDCTLGLKRFLTGITGIVSVEMGGAVLVLGYDESLVSELNARTIAVNTLAQLGYEIDE